MTLRRDLSIEKSLRMARRLRPQLRVRLERRTVLSQFTGLLMRDGKKLSFYYKYLKMEDKRNRLIKGKPIKQRFRYFYSDLETTVVKREPSVGLVIRRISGRNYKAPVYLPEVKRRNTVIKWFIEDFKHKKKLFEKIDVEFKSFKEIAERLIEKKRVALEEVILNRPNVRFLRKRRY